MSEPEPCERLFFAALPTQAQREAFAHATHKALSHCEGRPVPVASLHLTLLFLGSVPRPRISEVSQIARQIAGQASGPLELTFDHLEHWPRPQVLCAAGSTPCPKAADLVLQLRNHTQKCGFLPDLKPFREHVTVARKVTHPTAVGPLEPVRWIVGELSLMSSRTDSRGPLYSVVESYPLDGRNALQ